MLHKSVSSIPNMQLVSVLYILVSSIPTSLFTHPAGGKATSRVGPKIVLDHVHVYIMYVYKNYVCSLWVCSQLVVYDVIDNASSSRAHED